MRVKYNGRAHQDLNWWHKYYRQNFPSGRLSAYKHYAKTISLLKQNPFLGSPIDFMDVRKLVIPNTPFIIFYRITEQTLEILQVRDGRREPYPGFHEEITPIR